MLSVSSNFTAAEKADANQVASKIYLVLGNYASSSAYGATASASSSDGSGNYPASGAIDGDRTELNVGAASGADNDTGLSSWRSSTAPSVTPQTFTINFGTSRTINRIKLYHLSSHGLKSYKFESSPDNSTWTLIAKTTDQGGTIATTNQLDTIDFSDVTCHYVRLTVSDTVVGADMANVVEIECYRKVDVTDRVTSAKVNRSRDYKLQNPLASAFTLTCDNSDRFFSFSHTPTSSEVSSGFVNSELRPNIGVIIQYGFAYGGGTPELATVFNGYADRITVDPNNRAATIEGRDFMKPLLNQIVSSKLKSSQDIKACIQYALNLANISTWEMSLDSTSLTVDYFFINNQSVLTVIRDLVQASADAAFWFDESGTATFKYYVTSTPQSHLDSSESDFEAGTVRTNIDTTSIPNQIGRKWFLIDDFADGNFNSNPVWTTRTSPSSVSDTTQADFVAGSVLTNIDTGGLPGSIRRRWFLIDAFADNDYTANPLWYATTGPQIGTASPITNKWSVSGNKLKWTGNASQEQGIAISRSPMASAAPNTGTWQVDLQIANQTNFTEVRFYILTSGPFSSSGRSDQVAGGYFVKITKSGSNFLIALYRDDSGSDTSGTLINSGSTKALDNSTHTIKFSRYDNGFLDVLWDGAVVASGADTTYSSTAGTIALMVKESANPLGPVFSFSNLYYSALPDDTGSPSSVQSVFESRTFDQGANLSSEGSFTSTNVTPTGASLSFFTATSSDGITWDSYVSVTNGGLIQSSTKRYIKYKILFILPIDKGTNFDLTNINVADVTLTYFVSSWTIVSSQLKLSPGTSSSVQGIDTSLAPIVGTWRANFKLTVGSASGEKARMYIVSTGYDATKQTYLSGYYAELDQAASKIRIGKINASGTRSALLEVAKTITSGTTYSVRLTRTSAGLLELFWNEVSQGTATDTSFSTGQSLSFEVDPNSDQNGNTVIDDVYYSPAVDGTGAISTAQSAFESQVVDMTASVASFSLFQSNTNLPSGTSISFYTATSSDNITYDAYVSASSGSIIGSAVKRYIKWKAVLTCPVDDGNHNANLTTPVVFDVTLNWFTGTGSNKFPTSVSYTFRYDTTLLVISQEYADNLGGDSAIINDVTVQSKPLYLSGNDTDVQWQGTTQTPPVAISASAPLTVTNGQILTYAILLSGGMDTSRMSGASPAAAAITFASSASGTWKFTTIHPTRPVLQITITISGTITNLQVQGKSFSNSNTGAVQSSSDASSINLYGDRKLSISNQYIVNNTIASSIASKFVSNYKNPTSYIPGATVRPTFSAQLNDRVTIVDDNTDISADYVIAGIQHELTASVSGGQSQTDLLLLKVTS